MLGMLEAEALHLNQAMVGPEALLQIAVDQVQGVLGVVTCVEDMLDFVGGVPLSGHSPGVSNGLAELRGAY